MGNITSETQSAFFSGRFILDRPMMINEILAWARQMGKEMFIFKIDFENAYDNVHWGFLLDMLRQLGFPIRWCLWVEGILMSVRSSVLVNGAPTFEFDCKKGIRQGDPLSPFLFVIVIGDDEEVLGGGGSDRVKKLHWVGWDKVTVAKGKGGLGVNRLENSNQALVLKWLWRYRSESNALWKKVVDAVHSLARNWDLYPVQTRYKGGWYNIVKWGKQSKVADVGFNSLIRADIGNGDLVRFWMDPWLCGQPLKVRFPNLYRLETGKHCKVSDWVLKAGGARSFGWKWRRNPTSLEETLELTDCFNMLTTVKLSEKKDSWLWHGIGSEFTVANVKDWKTLNVSNLHAMSSN
ncbi:uncharacterized protein LOC110943688 [Helianthus annuus]|uniref:uncharacterized protein LOC110943688 n=1 Tax=Helianthus annuus TaxID=4232 RepID=UPI000B9038EF|nr:uncharacterized protein LOC110943688 [Helianthus annuus]